MRLGVASLRSQPVRDSTTNSFHSARQQSSHGCILSPAERGDKGDKLKEVTGVPWFSLQNCALPSRDFSILLLHCWSVEYICILIDDLSEFHSGVLKFIPRSPMRRSKRFLLCSMSFFMVADKKATPHASCSS